MRVATVVTLPAPPPLAGAPATTAAATIAPAHRPDRAPVTPRVAAVTPRALLAAAASAGLLPFAARGARRRATGAHPDFGAIAAGDPARGTFAAPRRRRARTPRAAGQAARSRHGGGGTPPKPPDPFGPPGNAGAGGAAGASGGAASGVWCALLIGGLVLLVQQLRRYRFRLVVPAPRGVVLLLQRPG